MIVCSCNALSEHDLRRAVTSFRRAEPHAVITPGRALHALGLRIRCHGCLGNLFEIIAAEDPQHIGAKRAAIQHRRKPR